MNATMPLISAPTASPWQSPLINGEVYTHDLAGAVTAIAHSDDWLAIVIGQALRLYRLKHFNWNYQHRQINLGMTPRHLLFGGMDSRYLITIDDANHYEAWDRVSAKLQTVGEFVQHPAATQYQIINQHYLLATSGSTLRLYPLNWLVPNGSDLLAYPLEFRPEPIAQATVSGDLCAVTFHAPSQTIFCASYSLQTLTLTPIAAADGQLVPLSTGTSYPLEFVGLSCTENQLLLQVLSLDGQLRLPGFLEFGEVPSDFAVFGVLGDESEGFERVEAVFNLRFAAGGVFELGGDRIQAPFPTLSPQEVTDGGELVFEVFGPGLLGGGDLGSVFVPGL
jgi:hypothetical protein